MMPKHPAVFFSTDGTTIEDVGYNNKQSLAAFYPYSISSPKKLQQPKIPLILINQSGISNGYATEKSFRVLANQLGTIEFFLST